MWGTVSSCNNSHFCFGLMLLCEDSAIILWVNMKGPRTTPPLAYPLLNLLSLCLCMLPLEYFTVGAVIVFQAS